MNETESANVYVVREIKGVAGVKREEVLVEWKRRTVDDWPVKTSGMNDDFPGEEDEKRVA